MLNMDYETYKEKYTNCLEEIELHKIKEILQDIDRVEMNEEGDSKIYWIFNKEIKKR